MSRTAATITLIVGLILLALGFLWSFSPPAWSAQLCAAQPCNIGVLVGSVALLFGAVLTLMGVIALVHHPRDTVTINLGPQAEQDAEMIYKLQQSLSSGKAGDQDFAPSSAELQEIAAARKELFVEMPKEERTKATVRPFTVASIEKARVKALKSKRVAKKKKK